MTNKHLKLFYYEATKNIFYSLVFILPMLFLYELMCLLHHAGEHIEIRNGADVFIRQLFIVFGAYSESIYGLILFIILLIILYLNRSVMENERVKLSFLFYMLIESIFWSFGFIILMATSENILLSIIEPNLIAEKFYLAIGAGIWEEFLFRVIVIGLVSSFMIKIIGYGDLFSSSVAVLFSALLFSLFHYLGPLGENFVYKSFHLRTLAGLFLGTLYIFRGLGITAYTHIFYDMIIISL